MTQVDLALLEHLADVAAAAQPPDGLTASLARRTHELVAELRAAREVVKEADSMRSWLPLELVHRLDDYDEAVGS